MLQKINPDSVVRPVNQAYHHVVVVPAAARMVYVAGQVGLRADGSLPETLAGQATQAWANVMACLAAAGAGPEHVVKITTYLLDADDYPAFAQARAAALGDARPASTAVLIKGLLKPEWRFEIEAVAAVPA